MLEIELPWLDDLVRLKKPARLPTVLNHEEIAALFDAVPPEHELMARLLYGTGMRLMECLRLRTKGIDFVRREILIHDGPATTFERCRSCWATRMYPRR